MRRCHVWLALGGLVALAGAPVVLHAQGFSVNEHGSCAMGRAGTGVAAPCDDGSAMFFNPAAENKLVLPHKGTEYTLAAPAIEYLEALTRANARLDQR